MKLLVILLLSSLFALLPLQVACAAPLGQEVEASLSSLRIDLLLCVLRNEELGSTYQEKTRTLALFPFLEAEAMGETDLSDKIPGLWVRDGRLIQALDSVLWGQGGERGRFSARSLLTPKMARFLSLSLRKHFNSSALKAAAREALSEEFQNVPEGTRHAVKEVLARRAGFALLDEQLVRMALNLLIQTERQLETLRPYGLTGADEPKLSVGLPRVDTFYRVFKARLGCADFFDFLNDQGSHPN